MAFLSDDDREPGRAFFDALDAAARSLERAPLDPWESLDDDVRAAYAGAEMRLAEEGGGRVAELARGIARAVNCASFEEAAGNVPDFVAGELAARVLLAVGDAVRKRDRLRLGPMPKDPEKDARIVALGTQIARLAGVARARVEVSELDRALCPALVPADDDRPMEAEVAFVERVLAWLDVPGASVPSLMDRDPHEIIAAMRTGEPPTMVIGPADGAGGVSVPPGPTAWGPMGALGDRLFAPQALRDVLSAAIAWAYTPSNAEVDRTPGALLAAVRAAVASGILPTPIWTPQGVVVDPAIDRPDAPPQERDVAAEAEDAGETLERLASVARALANVILAARTDLDPEDPDDAAALSEAFDAVVADGGTDLAAYVSDLRTHPGPSAALRYAVETETKSAAAQQYRDLKRALQVPDTEGPTFNDLVILVGSVRRDALQLRELVQTQHRDLRSALKVPDRAGPTFGELVHSVAAIGAEAERLAKKHGLAMRQEDAHRGRYVQAVLQALSAQIEAQSMIADAACKGAEEARKAARAQWGELADALGCDPSAEPPPMAELVATLRDRLTVKSSAGMAPRLRSVLGLAGTESVDECLATMRQRLDELGRAYELARSERDAARHVGATTRLDLVNAWGDFDALAMAVGVTLPTTLQEALAGVAKLRDAIEARDVTAQQYRDAHDPRVLGFVLAFREVADVFGVDLESQHPSEVVSAARVLWGSHADGSEDGAVATLDVIRKALTKIEELHNGASALLKAAAAPEHLFGDARRFGLLEEAVGMIGCGVSDALDMLEPPKGAA